MYSSAMGGALPELVVVADGLVPGDRLVEPGRLEGFLVADGLAALVGAAAGGDPLAVDDVEVPAQLVVLGVVAGVPEGDAEIEGGRPVQGVDGLDGGVERLGGGEDDPRVLRDAAVGVVLIAEIEPLRRGLLVGDVDVAHAEERQQLRGARVGDGGLPARAVRGVGQDVGADVGVAGGAEVPLAVAVRGVFRERGGEERLHGRGQGRQDGGRDHAVERGADVRGDGVGRLLVWLRGHGREGQERQSR